jgi:hypothetical protein
MHFSRVLPVAALLAVLLLGAACASKDPVPPGSKEIPGEQIVIDPDLELKPALDWPVAGQPAPAFSLPSLAGDEVTVPGDFEGRAVLMLFFSLG